MKKLFLKRLDIDAYVSKIEFELKIFVNR